MIGRLTDDGTLRFGKAVPRRRDTIDLSFLAVTLPPRGRRSLGSWRNWCGDYRSASTSCETVGSIQLLHALVSAFRFAQRPASDPKGSRGELYGNGLEPR